MSSSKVQLTLSKVENLCPRSGHVLVKVLQAKPYETSTGIVIPSVEKDQFMVGIVLQIGPGTIGEDGKVIPISNLNIDDKVILGQYSGTKIHIRESGVEHIFILIKDADILGIIDKGETKC